MTNEANETKNPLEEIRKIQKRLCSKALTYAIGIALALILFGYPAVAKGLILGTLFSIVNFILMGRSMPKYVGCTRAKAHTVGLFSILGRYVILAVPLIVGIKRDDIEFWAVVVGIFSVQLVALVDYTVVERFLRRKRTM